ncbi:hypothetical protein BJX96DRAFT_157176, partial [Aspergillus floccosus]
MAVLITGSCVCLCTLLCRVISGDGRGAEFHGTWVSWCLTGYCVPALKHYRVYSGVKEDGQMS